jgi:hypothetical protein
MAFVVVLSDLHIGVIHGPNWKVSWSFFHFTNVWFHVIVLGWFAHDFGPIHITSWALHTLMKACTMTLRFLAFDGKCVKRILHGYKYIALLLKMETPLPKL